MLAVREDADVDDFELTSDGKTAILAWNTSGRSELEILDLDSGQRRAGPELPAEILFGLVLSRDERGARL